MLPILDVHLDCLECTKKPLKHLYTVYRFLSSPHTQKGRNFKLLPFLDSSHTRQGYNIICISCIHCSPWFFFFLLNVSFCPSNRAQLLHLCEEPWQERPQDFCWGCTPWPMPSPNRLCSSSHRSSNSSSSRQSNRCRHKYPATCLRRSCKKRVWI